ncbi:MAG: V-type ATP synthase alpha chain [Promethearchaeota archaeon]|nr:MAG: V-type ATP synthase alpha chain [Candidatus Lokiarchaeota archaeon]
MTESNELGQGYISSIKSTVIHVKGLENTVKLRDLIKVTKQNISGEVIQIYEDYVAAQCYENTNNLKLGQEVVATGHPLSMELGPGLLKTVYDGIQRPLERYYEKEKAGFLSRGFEMPSLPRNKKWHFIPKMELGKTVSGGQVIGEVQETSTITHYIMVPPKESGKLTYIADEGDYNVEQTIYKLTQNNNKEKSFNMIQRWPVTLRRPFYKKLNPTQPLVTGTRVIDLLFPIAKGGTVAVPGGFGTGKTVLQQSLAKWCDADIVIFISCGERGNEVADLLKEFPKIKDPRTGKSLLERLMLIANTSNMPVSAREASIFSGITIAEYYRDMGYHVVIQADSTSRWAEALREISGLLEEMPAEEGYPAYLPSKLSSFYERGGLFSVLGSEGDHEKLGSVSVIGSVSPPAGDFSEPVTSNTKRFVQVFWALDEDLAYEKHYPAINWIESYSNYPDNIGEWWNERDIDWPEISLNWWECREEINKILSVENELQNIKQLIGEENLPEDQQLDLFVADMIKEGFLIQNAFDDIDNFTMVKKLLSLTKIILLFHKQAKELLDEGVIIEEIKELDIIDEILRIKNTIPNDEFSKVETIKKNLLDSLQKLRRRRI